MQENNNKQPENMNKPSMKDVLNQTDVNTRQQFYNQYVKDVTPTHNWFANVCKAFLAGGIICTIGQGN